MANKSIKNPWYVSKERFSRLEEYDVDINHNLNLFMENIENELGINEDGHSNLKAKSKGNSADRDEPERKSKK